MTRHRPFLFGFAACLIALLSAPAVTGANPAQRHPLQVGFEMTFATAPGEQTQWLCAPALNVAYTLRRSTSIGIQRLTFGDVPTASGERSHFGLTAYVEQFRFIRPLTQLYGQAGVGWQTRSGAGIATTTGIALSAQGGLRRWLLPQFSVGAMVRVLDVLSAGWAMSPRVLPQGAIVASLGFSMEGHF